MLLIFVDIIQGWIRVPRLRLRFRFRLSSGRWRVRKRCLRRGVNTRGPEAVTAVGAAATCGLGSSRVNKLRPSDEEG